MRDLWAELDAWMPGKLMSAQFEFTEPSPSARQKWSEQVDALNHQQKSSSQRDQSSHGNLSIDLTNNSDQINQKDIEMLPYLACQLSFCMKQ
ncbi:hypothetical protein GUJ93_ZPchr0012g20735 [Zizania palustris]|uniref:Uncharacterized protein n=1 Tax=Zizania palustris TaxID=103762 RepID=A0A8J6BZI8_ZIZPA|nr:hypothetical protein GUJ93_ZPchr0012g20735 [Zizania palustris]